MTTAAGFLGAGGETYLVIRHNVHGATDGVPFDVRKIKGLHHDALASERRIAVDEDREGRGALAVALQVNAGAGAAQHNRVDGFEVTRVIGQRYGDLLPVDRAFTFIAEVILDVAVTTRGVRDMMLGEPFEEVFGLLPAGIDEDVEATAVGHADDDIADTEAGRTAD